MLSLLIAASTTGAGWAHHFVLMIGYAIVVGRWLSVPPPLEIAGSTSVAPAAHSAALSRLSGARSAASSSLSRSFATSR
jgi:hypothetical protein